MDQDQSPRTFLGYPFVPAMTALASGYPFLVLAVMSLAGWALPGVDTRAALLAYGAIVLSFFGGAHWAVALYQPPATAQMKYGALSDWRGFATALAPGLVGFIALLLPLRAGAWLLVAAFAGLALYDAYALSKPHVPKWFLGMRLYFEAFSVASLIVGILMARP